MNLRTHRARTAGTVVAIVAAATTTVLALSAGSASADEPGRCTENVNVRAEPDVTSKIVALCEAGTEVALGEERDGFVRVEDLGGWAARDFVKADAAPASRSGAGAATGAARDGDRAADRDGGATDRVHRTERTERTGETDRDDPVDLMAVTAATPGLGSLPR